MLPEEELAELANDIAENGLREPLVLQVVEGVDTLIDGRNRRAACALIHIQPEVRYLNGEDADAFIFSTNIARRNLTAGQRAMLTAIRWPEGEQGKRSDLLENANKLTRSEQVSVSRARAILNHDDLVRQVLDDTLKLNAAYDKAKERETKKEKEAQEQKERKDWLDRIRREKPYLAEAVDSEKETLDNAIRQFQTMLTAEQESAKQVRSTVFDGIAQIMRGGRGLANPEARETTIQCLLDPEYEDERSRYFVKPPKENGDAFQVSKFLEIVKHINALAREIK
jgi:hypothetical protein